MKIRNSDLFKDPENHDYPCRRCPLGKPLSQAKTCPVRCAFWRLWVGKRLKNARTAAYGDDKVRYK